MINMPLRFRRAIRQSQGVVLQIHLIQQADTLIDRVVMLGNLRLGNGGAVTGVGGGGAELADYGIARIIPAPGELGFARRDVWLSVQQQDFGVSSGIVHLIVVVGIIHQG